jgi:hypothetical protein
VNAVLLTAPLSVVALGLGFMAQSLTPSQPRLDSRVLDALLPANAATGPAAADPRAIQARRAVPPPAPTLPGQEVALAEPAVGRPVPLEVRVALLSHGEQPTLSATGPWVLRGGSGEILAQGPAGVPVDLAAMSGVGDAWLETRSGQAPTVNGQAYEGRIRLVRDGGTLTVVNHLLLERYITSVVGAEMPSSWSIEALKAQAVAARSYALAHLARPASRYWHLGDTTRWQAYRGLASVTGRTNEAVALTNGMILSYQGGIVESLYAATSRISQEAHGHLGASMSQHGAQDLAQQGLRYNEILGRYYQGASLARLQAGAS